MAEPQWARWLRQAEADLQATELLLEGGRFDACAFYAHQVAEKALKAMLYALGERAWGHSLVALLEQIARVTGAALEPELLAAARTIDQHYVSARYPDAFQEQIPADHYTYELAEEGYQCAQLILEFARASLVPPNGDDSGER
jgi:HEPN domain-containing protein